MEALETDLTGICLCTLSAATYFCSVILQSPDVLFSQIAFWHWFLSHACLDGYVYFLETVPNGGKNDPTCLLLMGLNNNLYINKGDLKWWFYPINLTPAKTYKVKHVQNFGGAFRLSFSRFEEVEMFWHCVYDSQFDKLANLTSQLAFIVTGNCYVMLQ